MPKLHELEQKYDSIAREMRSLNQKIGDSEWSDEQRGQFKDMQSKLSKIDSDIEIQKELRRLHKEDLEAEKQKENEHKRSGRDDSPEKRYHKAFDKMLRNGLGGLERSEIETLNKRSQSIGVDSKGGYTVPKDFQDYLIESMKAYGGVSNNCTVLTTGGGNEIPWPTSDGTSEMGDFIAENSKTSEQDMSFGIVQVGAKKITSKSILISNELLNDSSLPMDQIIGRRIATRIGRKEANAIINGTGAGLENSGLAKQVTNKVDVGTAGKVSWKDINELVHSIDEAYINSDFALAFNRTTLKLLEQEVDGQGRPLWLPAVSGMTPATILGHRYFTDAGISSATSTNKFVFAGDWKRFILRRVRYMQLKRLTELYAESDQTAFLAFHRFDTLLEDTAAIKALAFK